MRIGDALSQAVTQLRNQGVESPRLDADLLLAHVLGVNRAAILARLEQALKPKELTLFRDLVTRRAQREPLAYIIGHREFFGLDFVVDHRVLIPRPETELLVELALQMARGLASSPQIADAGTGSGAIAVTLAVHLPQATIYALDDSAGALAVVHENVCRHGVAEQVRCLQSDLLSSLPGPVDLITANLPYVTSEEWSDLAPEIRDYEPRAALDGGPDGLVLIRRLLATAGPWLRSGGAILVEIGANQGEEATALARENFRQARVQLYQDYAGLDRVVVVATG